MSILLYTFFISLLGIILIIGRKLALVRGGGVVELEHVHPFVPDVQKIKYLAGRNTKKLVFILLVIVIRTYVKTTKFFKQRWEELKTLVKSIALKTKNGSPEESAKQEVSGFLKMMSDYKHKIKTIKHKIKEEEELI